VRSSISDPEGINETLEESTHHISPINSSSKPALLTALFFISYEMPPQSRKLTEIDRSISQAKINQG
jgi:hypothetical protein